MGDTPLMPIEVMLSIYKTHTRDKVKPSYTILYDVHDVREWTMYVNDTILLM